MKGCGLGEEKKRMSPGSVSSNPHGYCTSEKGALEGEQAGECGVKQRPVEAAEYDRHSYNQQRHTQEPGREFYQRSSLVS